MEDLGAALQTWTPTVIRTAQAIRSKCLWHVAEKTLAT